MEDFKEFDIKDFACILLLMALFPTEETEEMFKKYAEKEKPTEV